MTFTILKRYSSKPRTVEARQIITESEMVSCYNGMRVGTVGNYIVVDEQGKTMLMSKEKFEKAFNLEEGKK